MTDIEKFFEQTTEQEQDYKLNRMLEHNIAVRENWQLISAIKECLSSEDYIGLAQLWIAVPESIKHHLWVAPTKGGIFTTQEIAMMKSNDAASARMQVVQLNNAA